MKICTCPAGTSGIIYNSTDSRIFQFNMPPASATCGGCPSGYTESCYPTQSDSNPANDIADVDVQCGTAGVPNYSTFCACPSNGQQCYTFNQPNQVTDVQLYTFCDAGGTIGNGINVRIIFLVSCDGCNTISTNNANTGTATTFCKCPSGTSGIIYNSTDSRIIKLNMPSASATCGGCPSGYTQSCYPSQPSSDPSKDFPDVNVHCGGATPNYSNFCACPSNGQQCFTFGQAKQVFDVQLYTFCDAGGTCLTYLIFYSTDDTDFITNNVQSVTYVQENSATGNLLPFSQISCDGCNTISNNNAKTGTSVTYLSHVQQQQFFPEQQLHQLDKQQQLLFPERFPQLQPLQLYQQLQQPL
uniref:Uncharacterized protein n=1 Tax=Meloidogyne floridensis TaxID=298350 RepID=A0A915NA76_9BILA